MKFSAREDIDVPISDVFDVLADFEGHERAAMRRGIQVSRLDELPGRPPGMSWNARLKFRGRMRDIGITLDRIEEPEVLGYLVESEGLRGSFEMELVSLSVKRTRVHVALDLKPQNLSGRLLIQSLRLVKPALSRRFKDRISDYARHLQRGEPRKPLS